MVKFYRQRYTKATINGQLQMAYSLYNAYLQIMRKRRDGRNAVIGCMACRGTARIRLEGPWKTIVKTADRTRQKKKKIIMHLNAL